jgi:hypothetical protein
MLGVNASIVQKTAAWIIAIGPPPLDSASLLARVRKSRLACIVVAMWRRWLSPHQSTTSRERLTQPGREEWDGRATMVFPERRLRDGKKGTLQTVATVAIGFGVAFLIINSSVSRLRVIAAIDLIPISHPMGSVPE